MVRTSYLLLALVTTSVASFARPEAARAQVAQQPRVDLSPVEITAGASFKRIGMNAASGQEWQTSMAMAVDARITGSLAVATQVETDLQRSATLLAGAEVSTGFYYGSNRDPVPGRFFARVLGGAAHAGPSATHPAVQLAAGADILLSRRRKVGFRWEAGFELIAGAAAQHTNGRVALGLIFGPHLRHS